MYNYLLNQVFLKLFQSNSVRRPLGFQLDSQRPLGSLSEKNFSPKIVVISEKKGLHFDFISNFAITLPKLW